MKVYTLIDITETKANKLRNNGKHEINQQANFNTLFNTISFRFNPEWTESPTVTEMTAKQLKDLGFGSEYKTKQKVWTWEFELDRLVPGPFLVDLMKKDLDLIPIITGLNETININTNVFRTTDPGTTNIVFEASIN